MAALKRRSDRTGTPSDLLVVGLGNPGDEYAGTRHNLGVEVVELLCDRHGGRLRAEKGSVLTDTIRIGDHRVGLAFPLTYMNESGRAVKPLVRRHSIDDLTKLVIIHDELDLPVGRLKLKLGGGLAGNNGLKSIKQHLGTADFTRIRLGIGKPPGRQSGADYVLRRPAKAERPELDVMVAEAADAVEMLVAQGLEPTMNRYNTADR
ncbi:MAG: aminoacyl-tRNA hydrolase [Acidimicrobiales bacterium]|nr:aminoacyl-tRNA hydrolase [Acidimicrobiales bacterium]